MIDVKCHVQCGLPTITNPCGKRQVDEGIKTKEGKQKGTADPGVVVKDLEKPDAALVDHA